MGPRTGLDVCGKSHHYRDYITGPSSPYRVAIQTELPRSMCYFILSLKSEGKFALIEARNAGERSGPQNEWLCGAQIQSGDLGEEKSHFSSRDSKAIPSSP